MVDGIVLPTLSRMMLLFHWGIILPLYCRLMENPPNPMVYQRFPYLGGTLHFQTHPVSGFVSLWPLWIRFGSTPNFPKQQKSLDGEASVGHRDDGNGFIVSNVFQTNIGIFQRLGGLDTVGYGWMQ